MAQSTVVERIWINASSQDTTPNFVTLLGLLPDLGAVSVPATLQAAGWVTIGGVSQYGDSGDLASEKISVKPIREGARIFPPGAQTAEGRIIRHNGIETVSFKAYDISQTVRALDSGVEALNGYAYVTKHSASLTDRAMVVEYQGQRCDFYPKVQLLITDLEAGYGVSDGDVAITGFEAQVFAASLAPGGCLQITLQVAT
jgi:hypothetical protein